MRWQAVATIADAERARPWLPVRAAGNDIVLAQVEGTWFAVEGHCTHAGCAFADDATLEDGTIVCGCHGSEFDLRTGEVQRGPAEYDVRTFPVRVVGEALEVEV